MDFRTCPACHASVLEDDVQDCPFCGASMSGKPSPKPKSAPTRPATTTSAAKPAQPAGSAPPASPTRTKSKPARPPADADDGDPFEVDTRSLVQAPPVSPKPAKGRMVRVVCPMCETPGFITPQQQGAEVKCCNPKCLMPVFTAPKPEVKPAEEPQARRGLSGAAFAGIAIVLIAAVAAGLYYFVLRDRNGQEQPVADVPPLTPQPGEPETTESPETESPAAAPELPPVPLDELRGTSLAEIVKAAQQRQQNRSKPYGRKLAAEAYAETGDLPRAHEQLESMRNVPGYVPFYEIEPLVAIALRQRAAGDAAAVEQTLTDALSKAELPDVGRPALDAAGALAAALVASGRLPDAVQVAQSADDDGPRGEASLFWRSALDSRSLDVDSISERPWVQNMPSAQWVSVTRSVFEWGGSEPALAWAKAAATEAVRENAVAAWAGLMVLADPANLAPVEAAVAEASPTGQTRIWCAVADAQLSGNDTTAAQQSLSRALAALQQSPSESEAFELPDTKGIYDSEGQPRAGLPDPDPYRARALAAMDAAELQAETGDAAGAWQSAQLAVQALRGAAPSPVATQALLDECEQQRESVEARLTEQVGVGQDDLFRAFNRYRKQCGLIHDQAVARFGWQAELMRRAAGLGLLQPAWDEMTAREQQADPNRREAWFATTLPGLIALRAREARNSTLADSIRAVIGRDAPVSPRDLMETEFAKALEAGDHLRAADVLRRYDQQQRDEQFPGHIAMLRAVSRLIAADRHDDALDLTLAVSDPLAREDALWLIAASVVRDGKHSDFWRNRNKLSLTATETASLYRGFITGLPLAPAENE